MASRLARTRSGRPSNSTAGPRMRSFWCPTACYAAFRRRHRRARSCAVTRSGASCSPVIARAYPELAAQFDADAEARAAARLGSGHSDLSGRSQGHREPGFFGRGRERDRAACALADRRRRGPCPSTKTRMTFGARATSSPTITAAATCISASASTRWARRSTAWRSRS